MSGSGYTCVRHVFSWLNLLIWISGCLLITGGVLMRVYYPGQSTMVPHVNGAGADTFLITIGSICFVLAFLGCCGAFMQSKCLLVTYFSLLVVILCGEFVSASLAFVYREPIGRHVRIQLQRGIQEHYNMSDNSLIPIWDHLQKQLHCCGVDSYKDYHQIDAWKFARNIPDSCCIKDRYELNCGNEDFRGEEPIENIIYSDGCASKLTVWLVERLHYAAIIGFLVAFIQLFGLVSSLMLCCTVRHRRGSRTYQSYKPAS